MLTHLKTTFFILQLQRIYTVLLQVSSNISILTSYIRKVGFVLFMPGGIIYIYLRICRRTYVSQDMYLELDMEHSPETSFSLCQVDPWCLFSQLHSHNNSKIHLFQYLVWLQFIWQDLSHSHFQVSYQAILDLGSWRHCQSPSWDESCNRLTQHWLTWCNIGSWWSTKMPQLKWRFESGSSVTWRDVGKLWPLPVP